MVEENQKLKESDLIGLVLMQMKDGQDLYQVKVITAVRNGRAYGYVPNFECEIVRETDGKSAIIQSKTMFDKIRAGTVRIVKKG